MQSDGKLSQKCLKKRSTLAYRQLIVRSRPNFAIEKHSAYFLQLESRHENTNWSSGACKKNSPQPGQANFHFQISIAWRLSVCPSVCL